MHNEVAYNLETENNAHLSSHNFLGPRVWEVAIKLLAGVVVISRLDCGGESLPSPLVWLLAKDRSTDSNLPSCGMEGVGRTI